MSSIDFIKVVQTLGCSDELKCAVASRVYLDLKEVIKVKNLEPLFDKELDLLYFRGQRENCDSEIVVPIPSCKEVDLLEFEELQRKLGGDLKYVTMAICDPSSTILYYSVKNDFIDK